VTPNGKQVTPDATTRIHAFTGAMINSGPSPPADGPPPGDCCGTGGDPVNLATGLFTLEQTDLSLPDTVPIAMTRTYRSRDPEVRPFGPGTTHPYAMFLYDSGGAYQQADLVLPDGAKIHYVRISPGGGFASAVFQHVETATTSGTPTSFYKSLIAWNGHGWDLTLKDGTVYVFGENAPLQAIRDRYGNTISITHANGEGGNITRVTSPHGRWIAFTYAEDSNCSTCISHVTDNIGRIVRYTYDANGNLWKVTDPLGQLTEYTYDSGHNMLTVKNRNGVVYVTNEYTTAADAPTPVGWVKTQTHADGGVYQFAYTVSNGKSTGTDVTDPRGYVRRVTFNADGYTLTDTHGLGQTEVHTTTSDRPSTNNFITSTTDNLLRQTAHSYDPQGNETSIIRLAGTGNATPTTDTFDPVFNQVTSTTDPLNHTTTFEYDANGNVTAEVDPLNHRTTHEYNAVGQLVSVTDALQHTSTFAYAGGDLRTVQDPLGRVTTRFTDGAGRLVASTDPLGHITRYEYDALNRLTKTTDPSGAQTTLTYFPEGHLQTVTDAQNHTTTYGYDSMGRLSSRTDALGRSETFTYDVMGNLTGLIDRSGQLTTRAYDPLGRLQQITYADASTITYTYDGEGRLITVADSVNGDITRTYDSLDRLTSETTPQGTVSYSYDSAGRRATMTVTTEPTFEYGYDDAGRLTTVTQGTAVVSLQYDNADRRTSLTLPNGLTTEYTYDEASQLTGLTYKLGQTTLGDLTYTYDANGNRSGIGGSFARTALPQMMSTATYDAANQLTQWAGRTLSYDANSSLRSDGPTSYSWNARQQLVGVTGAASGVFGYDADGRRVQRNLGGATTQYLHAGAEVVQEQIGGGSVASRLPGDNVDEWWLRTDAMGALTPLVDAQGSSVALADNLGAIVTQYTYEPFGRTEVTGAATANRFAYTGRETEQDTGPGLYYYRARYYDANVSRFISQDPLGISAGINGYQYVGSNPINSTDPTGLYSLKGFPPARRAQMRQAVRQLYTRLKQNPCCIAPALRDRVLELIRPGENGAGVTFQYRNVIPVPSYAPKGVVVCGFVNGWSDFLSGTAQISKAAMDGTCDCPLPGTILHEVVHLTYSNFLMPWSAERKAYAAAEACFGPDCGG
jgi:RHS repeat-associated protein